MSDSEVDEDTEKKNLKQWLWEVVFEAETRAGKAFDVSLLWLIMFSVVVVMLESVVSFKDNFGGLFLALEWIFTILFTIEYVLRLWLVRKPLRYAFSFFGIVDLLSCLPTYLMLFFPGAQSLLVIRLLRLLRMFRVLKMAHHVQGANLLVRSIYDSRAKITVFLMAMAVFAAIVGTLAYLFENGRNGGGIDSIPEGIYWAVMTMTTVGYGDVVPLTVPGKFLAVLTSLSGFAVIAVPTGIFVSAVAHAQEHEDFTDACPGCGSCGHLPDARYCRKCGEKLDS